MNKVQLPEPWQFPLAGAVLAAGAACVYAASEDVGAVGRTGFSLWAFSLPPDTSPFPLPGLSEPRNKLSLASTGPFSVLDVGFSSEKFHDCLRGRD